MGKNKNKIEQNNKTIEHPTREAHNSNLATYLAAIGGTATLVSALLFLLDQKTDGALGCAGIAAILYACGFYTNKNYHDVQRQIKQLRHKNNKLKTR